MQNENESNLCIIGTQEHLDIRRKGLLIACAWSLIVVILLYGSMILQHNGLARVALNEARSNMYATIGAHLFLWGAGLLGIWAGCRLMQRRIRKWQRSEQIQSALFMVNSVAHTSGSLEEYLKTIHQRLGEVIDTSNFYVTLYDRARDEYTFPFHIDEYDTVMEDQSERLPKSLTDYVRKTGRPLLVDRAKDQELIQSGEVELVGTPAASWLGVPLVTSKGVIGVVVVQSYRETNLYSERDLELMQFVSGHIAQIIERKWAEEKLRQSKQRLLLHAQQTQFAYIEWTTEMEPLVWNPAAEKIFGFTKEEVLGRRVFEMIVPDEVKETVQEIVAGIVSGEGGTHSINKNVTKDGRTILCEWYNTPLVDDRGRVIAIASLAQDLTERDRAEKEKRKLEAQVQHAQKLESLGLLAGGIAHDFNNLLMAILGNADLALMELSSGSPARDCLEEIVKTTRTAAELCNQMLAYSGRGRFNITSLDLSEIVREMVNMIEVSTSKKAVVNYFLKEDLPFMEGDASQIRQVILNLITNASEAIGDQIGSISISTGIRECSRSYLADSFLEGEPVEGTYVYLEVSDTGCGIDKESIGRLFDPFYTTKFTGRGLGLSAVHGIVRGLKGAIKVTSRQGHGTTFTALFPVSGDQNSVEKEVREKNPVEIGFSGTLLIADDEESIRMVGKRLLERLGFNVLTADNGSHALDIFRKEFQQIDCTILDMTMPELDGKQTFRQMRKIKPDARIILSSGYTEQEVTENLLEEGLSGFIQKPYRLSSLSEKLAEVLT